MITDLSLCMSNTEGVGTDGCLLVFQTFTIAITLYYEATVSLLLFLSIFFFPLTTFFKVQSINLFIKYLPPQK